MKHIENKKQRNGLQIAQELMLSKKELKKIRGGDYTCTGGGSTLTCTPFSGSCMTVSTDGGTYHVS